MAIASLTAAFTQYDANLSAYWESATKSRDLLEAIDYILAHDAESISAAGRSINKFNLLELRKRVEPKAVALNSSTSRSAFFTRGRVTGLGI